MFKHMLITTDGSPLAERAFTIALEQAKLNGARVSAVMVVDLTPYITAIELLPTGIEGWQEALRLQAALAVNKVVDAAKILGMDCTPIVEEGPLAWQGILHVAERQGCDVIAMSSHGRSGLVSIVLGSQTSRVLAHGKTPVLVMR